MREHLWAGVTHDHWAKRPLIASIPASDAFHVASALSHYPIILALLWASEAAWWHYMVVAGASQVIWWQAKRANGRDWPNKIEQLTNYINNQR